MGTLAKSNKFPLWIHPTGHWGKKIRGKYYYYFGKNRDAALKEYVRVADDLQAGKSPRPKQENGLTVQDCATCT